MGLLTIILAQAVLETMYTNTLMHNTRLADEVSAMATVEVVKLLDGPKPRFKIWENHLSQTATSILLI